MAMLLVGPGSGWAQESTMYERYSTSYTVPYVEPFTAALGSDRGSLQINLQLNGSPSHRFTIDTGSTGLAITSSFIPGFQPTGTPGWVFYNSSGLLLQGYFTTIPVKFVDATTPSGIPANVIAMLPVLGVTSRTCLPGFPNPCRTTGHTFMLGAGFDRNTMGIGAPPTGETTMAQVAALNAAPPISQSYNPLLMIDQMQSGQIRRGYIITPNGVELGLTPQNVGAGFAYQRLKPPTGTIAGQTSSSPNNWQAASMAVSVNNQPYVAGSILMDTGVNGAFLHVPGMPTRGSVVEGTSIRVQLSEAGNNAGYSFVVGDITNPQTPVRVKWVSHGNSSAAFLNSSLRSYAAFNYLFDADGGLLGLSLNNALPNATAFVKPALSTSGARRQQ